MSVPGDFLSAGELPALVSAFSNLSFSETSFPSISTQQPVQLPPTASLADRRMADPPPDYVELVKSLSANGLVKPSLNKIPDLTGDKNYLVWADRLVNVLNLCGIDKILTGEWTKPTITTDKGSAQNAASWNMLDKWISITQRQRRHQRLTPPSPNIPREMDRTEEVVQANVVHEHHAPPHLHHQRLLRPINNFRRFRRR